MAKRGRRPKSRLDKAAEGIGRALGHLMNRLDKWRRQRDEIADDVRQVIETGQRVLVELGQDAGRKLAEGPSGPRRRRGKGGRRKGFKMSAAAKAKISAAAKKRWAERKKLG